MAANTSPSDELPLPAHLLAHEDDENANQRGYIKGTDFSLPYCSRWSRVESNQPKINNGLLRHVNCGYLSTQGVPPTLLALKQHAQALCILIHALSPTVESGEILRRDGADETAARSTGGRSSSSRRSGSHSRSRSQRRERSRSSSSQRDQPGEGDEEPIWRYRRNDAFDFLENLTVPYTNDDPTHHKTLTALVNEVKSRHEVFGNQYYCPLAEHKPRNKGDPVRPYDNHHNLVMHANDCLERLDHEFSSTGGLLSLLPTSDAQDGVPLRNARNSLLGQWLIYTQQLVARMHELERAYGNCLDALKGEAVVPSQHVTWMGTDAQTGRALVFPQDRWVLVNAGDEAFDHVHNILDKQEAMIEAKEQIWKKEGVVGEQIFRTRRHGDDYARGIVPVIIRTKYYRLMGRGRNTLFIVPAWENHPGVTYTKYVENKPTIVACPKPKMGERVTDWEQKNNERLERAREIEIQNSELTRQATETQLHIEELRAELQRVTTVRDSLMLAVDKDAAEVAAAAHEDQMRATRLENEVNELRRLHLRSHEATQRLREQSAAMTESLATQRGRVRMLDLENRRLRGEPDPPLRTTREQEGERQPAGSDLIDQQLERDMERASTRIRQQTGTPAQTGIYPATGLPTPETGPASAPEARGRAN